MFLHNVGSTNNFAQERQRSGLTVKTLSVKFLWNNKTILFIAFLQIVSISNRTTLNTCNSGMKCVQHEATDIL